MTKRILSLLLAAMMVLGSIIVVSAAEDEIDYDVENAFAIDVLKDINVLQGYDEDDFALDAAIKRYEMSLFIARALTGKTKDTYWEGAKNETPFTDLDGFKYAGSTTWTYNHGIILGKDNKTFDPNGYITYQEAIAMILRAWADYYVDGGLKALKIDDAIHYPWRHIELVEFLELDEKVDPTTKYTDVLSRGAVAQLIFNLLTFDPTDDKWAGLLDYNTEGTMAEIEFGLTLSPAEGVLVEITSEADEETGILDNNIVEFNEKGIKKVVGEIDGLTEDHFADFDVEIEKDVYYNIVYFTRVEVENNPITGEAIFGDEVETIVLSIEKVTIDDLVFTNALGADAEYKLNTEITKKNDKGETTEMALVSITAGDKTYPVIGEDALAVRYMDLDYTYKTISGIGSYNDDDELVGVAKATVEAAVKALTPIYADLRVEDTNGDGEADTLTVVPYVFAAVYSEAETEKADDGKTTAWSFDNFAVVLLDDTQATGAKFDTLDKDGKDAKQTINGQYGAAFVAKDSAKIAKEAELLETGVISFFDIREKKTNYITIDGVKYDYKYEALKGWDVKADYYDVATSTDILTTLYANNSIEDDESVESGATIKYINAWIVDNKVVAIVTVTPSGDDVVEPETPATKYAGIIDLLDMNQITGTQFFGEDFIETVAGKYYLVVDAVVNGEEIEKVLVYLGDASEYKYVPGKGTQKDQIDDWEYEENATLAKAIAALKALGGANAFYNVDELGNYVITVTYDTTSKTYKWDAVTGENYVKFVGGSTYVKHEKDGDDVVKYVDGSIAYEMEFNSEDYINYIYVDETKETETDTFVDNVAKANTYWLFVDDEGQTAKIGIPEYDSGFVTEEAQNGYGLLKNGDTVVVFVEDIDGKDANGDPYVWGFKYSMFTDALYALVDGSTELLNDYIRDGYYYFSVHSLFAGTELEIRVEEDSALADELIDIEADDDYCVVAVTNDGNYTLLETYDIENHAFDAIASLFGENAFHGAGDANINDSDDIITKKELENIIKDRYNLTASATRKMSNNDKNLVYVVKDGRVELSTGWPMLPAGCSYSVFFTPATDKPASYVVFAFVAKGQTTTIDTLNTLVNAGAPVTLTEDIAAGTLNLTSDAVINLNGYKISGVLTVNGNYELVINGDNTATAAAAAVPVTISAGSGADVIVNNATIANLIVWGGSATLNNVVADTITLNEATSALELNDSTVDTINVTAAGATVVVNDSVIKNEATRLGIGAYGKAVNLTVNGVEISAVMEGDKNPRAIYATTKGTVTIKDAVLNGGTGYTMNLYGSDATKDLLEVSDSELNGWTSFTGYKAATFTKCIVNGQMRPYLNTSLVDCDLTKAVLDCGPSTTVTIVLDGCTVNGVELVVDKDTTAEELAAVKKALKSIVCYDEENKAWDIAGTLTVQIGTKLFTFTTNATTSAAEITVKDVPVED